MYSNTHTIEKTHHRLFFLEFIPVFIVAVAISKVAIAVSAVSVTVSVVTVLLIVTVIKMHSVTSGFVLQ
jgi:hypothetical protein